MGIFDFFKSRKAKQTANPNSLVLEERHMSGVCEIPLDAKYTPEEIMTLGKREIFVFGSNLAGHHADGAARVALNRFGAVWGQGEGLQGNSYAIPTMLGNVETIKQYVDRFIEFAENEKVLTFYVTKIGCGIAGYDIKDIAPLFRDAYNLSNVIMPIEFVHFIENENCSIHPQKILDTIKAAHEERVKHLDSPIKVIGIGGGGTNSVERLMESAQNGVEYCVLNTDKTVLNSKTKLRAYLEGKTNDPCGIIPRGCSEEWFNRYFVHRANDGLVRSIIDNSAKHVIIVAGYGGATGTYGSKWLIRLCKEAKLSVAVVCTIPFDFEGERKQQRALDAANSLIEEGIEVKMIKAEDLKQKYQNLTFFNCFSLLDKYVAETVNLICDELTESQVKTKS